MAFRFPLESILKHRKRQEELAQREFIEARTQLEECLSGIDRMYRKIDETRLLIAEAQTSRAPRAMDFVWTSELLIEAEKMRIHKERLLARDLIRVLEEKEERLLVCLHERKIMEKLKDRRLEEYKEWMARFEQKELDDLTNARVGLGSRR